MVESNGNNEVYNDESLADDGEVEKVEDRFTMDVDVERIHENVEDQEEV